MTSARVSPGTRTIEEIHEQAIGLWILSKHRDADLNPAHGIYFAITEESWPGDAPEVTNVIALCALLSEVFGHGPLSDEERQNLNARAVYMFEQYEAGRGPLRFLSYFRWANRVAYAVGLVALLVSGLSWWVIGLMFAVWMCFGAARTAARMGRHEPRPSWEVSAIGAMHLAALVGLYTMSILHPMRG